MIHTVTKPPIDRRPSIRIATYPLLREPPKSKYIIYNNMYDHTTQMKKVKIATYALSSSVDYRTPLKDPHEVQTTYQYR